jgi:hypothetical protein
LIVDPRQQSASVSSRVQIAPQHVEGISWPNASISVGLSRATMLTAPSDDPAPPDTTVPPLAG